MTQKNPIFKINPTNQSPGDHEESAFYQKTLKAFEDLDYFKSRLIGQSRFLRINPDLKNDISKALESDNDQDIENVLELINISRHIDSPQNETPFNKILAAMNLQGEILSLSQEVKGVDGDTMTVVTLADSLFERMSTEPDTEELENYFDSAVFIYNQVRRVSEDLKQTGRAGADQMTKYDYMNNRLMVYLTALKERLDMNDYLGSLPEKDPEPITPEQVASDDLEIKELFQQARAAQSYGVKLGYKEQLFRQGSLLFFPPNIGIEMLQSATGEIIDESNSHNRRIHKAANRSLAAVIDSPKKSYHKGITMKATVSDDNDLSLQTNVIERASFEIQSDGTLASAYGGRNLAFDAAKQGSYGSFRKLQAEILANYIDLVSPLEITNTLNGVEGAPVLNGAQSVETKDPVDIVRQMLIRRIKTAKEIPSTDESSDAIREVRLHGVVWHIRQLPNGWSASPDAQTLAYQAGIVLQPGETFVRPHKRGSKRLGEVVGHQLISR
ncbi:MAG: hypothetical protein WAV04_00600 [Candidatus Microsaccharimonas sp.]